MPKITVAIPFYNDAPYLREAVDSILIQSFQDFELLLINDGSTDESAAISASYADKRIRIITFSENKGRPYARNAALENAKGDYLAWLDADDIAMPDRLQKQVNFLDTHPNVAITGGAIQRFHEAEDVYSPPLHYKEIISAMSVYCSILQSTACVRLAPIRTAHLHYDYTFKRSEDYEFWCKALFDAHMIAENLPEILTNYRQFRRPSKSKWHERVVRKNFQRFNIIYDDDDIKLYTSLSYNNHNFFQENTYINNILVLMEKIIIANGFKKIIPQTSLAYFFRQLIEELILHKNFCLQSHLAYKNSKLWKSCSWKHQIKYLLKKFLHKYNLL